MKAPIPINEVERLKGLRDCHILDTPPEQVYDDIANLAAHICNAPIAMISLVDRSRQWFKAKVGLTQKETARDVAFCAHAILQSGPLIVSDALRDERFADSQLVRQEPYIRFYAGFQLMSPRGLALGTLCAIDRKPRRLTAEQKRAMHALTRQVEALLESRRLSARLVDTLEKVKALHGLLPICSRCKRIRDDEEYWQGLEAYLRANASADLSAGGKLNRRQPCLLLVDAWRGLTGVRRRFLAKLDIAGRSRFLVGGSPPNRCRGQEQTKEE